MQRIKFLLIIILIFLTITGAKFLSIEERNAIQDALISINCTPDDLNFNKKWGDGKFILDPVKASLDTPLALPEIAISLKNSLTEDPLKSVSAAREILHLPESETKLQSFEIPPQLSGNDFLGSAYRITRSFKLLYENLNLEDSDREKYYNLFLGDEEENKNTILDLAELNLGDFFSLFIEINKLLTQKSFINLKEITFIEEDILIKVGTSENETFKIGEFKFEIIIDTGGDDTYKFSEDYLTNSLQIIIDLSGNDKYIGTEFRGPGSGLIGIGIIDDRSGDDEYQGGDLCFGAAIGGIGMVIDHSGNDKYFSNDFCLGAGYFGLGIIFDYTGHDLYQSSKFSQGFASIKGIGICSDKEGDDIYITGKKVLHEPLYSDHYQSLSQGFSIGSRYSGFAGGIAILFDQSGDDKYFGDVYSQGAGYWYSLGILIDESGNDIYSAWIYGQGAGIHLASGILIDLEGNDSYKLGDGVGQGGGHDLAIGILIDREGNDSYSGSGIAKGSGHANGIGILIDSSGDDIYSGVKDIIEGAATLDRGTCSIGILIDLGGKDKYSNNKRNNSIWFQGKLGVGIDKE
ncbi:hypothetical protein KAU33_05685 [Candidatus Dependentiae bacterium]|nr:hypothetical protein [Candidatus Dependentiae bacterium]